ncbi:MAG: DUF2066 domain-containing protein [Rhizobiales bacterium]|nr:DUF2066 domain-containing protein [Hyphomicrobiales bacterium]MBN9008714.1 DUF2066 domain-containing protein [Hyphomicrobiales bacterium]
MLRRALLAAASLAFLAPAIAAVKPSPGSLADLYQSVFVTSGTGEANRIPGFRQTLEDVLVKVSGDPRLIGDPRIDGLKTKAAELATSFTYLDLYSGRPLHDEQGSYDRPHYLTVDYDPAKIDAALHDLGLKPWTGDRPKLAVFLVVDHYGRRYLVTADDPRDAAMNEAFAAASVRYGLPMTFPPAALLADAALTPDSLPQAVDLTALAAKAGGALPLAGTLLFSDHEHGWIADWYLSTETGRHHWQVRGVNFDTAFRDAILGAAQVLSGNGEPGDVTPSR